jgi:hypothetical protein
MRRFVVILAAVAALVAAGPPASATGGWAVTYLDPLPGRLAPDTSYTIGFWVLQHGTRPAGSELGAIGLRLTAADGTTRVLEGEALPEAGHYATAVNLAAGTYAIQAVQGLLPPYDVGTLTVPGGVTINPVPPEMVRTIGPPKDYWGAVRPPGFPAGKAADAPATRGEPAPAADAPAAAPAPVANPAPDRDSGGLPWYALVIAALGGALLTLAAVRMPWRGREPDRPADEKGDILVIGG